MYFIFFCQNDTHLFQFSEKKSNLAVSGRCRSLHNLNQDYKTSNRPLRNIVTEPDPSLMMAKSKSSGNVTETGFKRKAKKIQTTAAVSKAFQSTGNQISLQRWKSLLQ